MKKLIPFVYILIAGMLFLFAQNEAKAVIADPTPINYKQPDGTTVTIKFKGDEFLSWGETLDGYTLLSDGNNGWAYAVLNAVGDLICSGILTHNQGERTIAETSLLPQIPKKLRYSQKQLDTLRSSSDARLKSATATTAFTPMGPKKLLLILIDFTDQPFNNPSTAHDDFNGLLNTVGYSGHNAHGSVHDFFYEASYGIFDLTTTVVGPYHAANNMAYYGATGSNGAHDKNAKALITEAVLAANADVNYAEYANENNEVEGVYVVFAGYGEATSGLTYTIWPHASSISTQTLDGVKVSKYSCSNELTDGGTELTTIGVICHEFGHVCGSPDFYDTDYEDNGQFQGDGEWDVMDTGLYNGSPSGSQPAHFNPYIKTLFNWATPTELTTSCTRTVADITTTPEIYKVNTKTSGEYFLIENRQQTGFNTTIPGHGLMIYRMGAGNYLTNKNTRHPQGFYPICASSTTAIPYNDPASYGDISSAGCPFPGSSGKHAFYDEGIPSAKSWAGVNTELPITNITENADHTVSFTIPAVNTCTPLFTTQASAFIATPVTYNTMNIAWTRGGGDQVIVVAREGSAVDFDPLNGTSYTANAAFKAGDELGAGNYVVYNGTGTSASLTGLNGGTAYYFAVYEYNTAANCYLTPALTGNGTTNCDIDPATYTENFERNTFGCWTATDNTGQGNWQIGTKSNVNYTPALTGNYAYFSSEYKVAHNYNADLISPTFDLSSYANVVLKYKHLFDGSNYYPSTAAVSYSIDNGATWIQLATYTSDSPANPQIETVDVGGASGKSQVKFKWNYTCSPTGAYMWAVDDIQVIDNTNYWTGTTDTDWFKTTNWSTGAIPTATTATVIPSAPANQPQINAAGAVCQNLDIKSGASLTMNASTAYALSVSGNWTNNGIFYAGIGTVSFNGTNDLQTIAGTSTTTFNILTLAKGAQSRILEATSPIAFPTSPASSPLVLTSGTFKLSSASTIEPFKITTSIPAAGGFWLNNNGAIITTGNYGWNVFGHVRVTDGILNIGNTQDNNLAYYDGSKLTIEGGSLNISGRLRATTTTTPNLTYIQSGGVVTVNKVGSTSSSQAPFDINSATSTSFAMSGGTIVIQRASSNVSDYRNLAPTYTVTGGTLQIGNGSTATGQTIRINSTVPIYNFVVNSTNSPTAKLVTNGLTVKGDVTVSGGTFDANSLNLNVAGNWINNGGSLTATGTVTFNGTAAQNIAGSAATTFNNLTLNNGAGLSLGGSLNTTVNGTLNFISGVLTTGTNKLIVGSAGNIFRTSGHVFGNLQKNIVTGTNVSRTFEIGDASEVNYAPVTVNFASVATSGNLIAATASGDHTSIGGSTLNSAKSVNRYWTLTNSGVGFTMYDGTFNFATSDLDASTNTTNLIGGNYSSSAWAYPTVGAKITTSTQLTGLTSFGDFALAEGFGKTSNGGNWSADATWSPSGVPVSTDNVLILSPGTVVVDVTNAVCQELTVQNGAKLQINPLQALTVSETITNNSDATGLVIKSDASGIGSLIAATVSGQATAESYLTAGRWYNVSPIVSGGAVSNFIQNSANGIPSKDVSGTLSYGMMSYNEAGNLWNSYYTATTADNLNAAQGYSLRRSTNGVVTYLGTISSGTKTISLSNAGEGWNCIGNPYTSAIKLNTAADADNNFLTTNATNLDASYACIYVWDESYKGYKILGNSPAATTERALGQDIFQSGQGFFVKAKADGAQIAFNQAMQLHQTDMQLKSGNISWPEFELTASLDKTKASTLVAFNSRMTKGLDPTYDAGLLRGSSGLELYTRLVDDNGVDFAVQCLPDNDFNRQVIPVGIDSKTGGSVVFSANVKNLPAGCSVILEDKLNNKFTNLSLSNYQTGLDAGSTGHSRFQIHTSYLTTGIKDGDLAGDRKLVAYAVGNTEIKIQGNVNAGAIATLYDSMGRMILTSILERGDLNIIHSQPLNTGVYMLSVKDSSAVKAFKLLIKE